jgi:hypothetical protein
VIHDNKEQLGGSQSPINCEIKINTMPHPRFRKYELYPHPLQKWLGEEASRGGGDQNPASASLGDGRSSADGEGEVAAAAERTRAGGKELPKRAALPRPFIPSRHAGRII